MQGVLPPWPLYVFMECYCHRGKFKLQLFISIFLLMNQPVQIAVLLPFVAVCVNQT
jgi:hypothetical protein